MGRKVSIIGAGNVGASLAQRLFNGGLANIVLVDIVEGLPQGKALDISQTANFLKTKCQVVGTNDYQDTAGSDIVIITAGISRKPGMTRDQLMATNMKIVEKGTEKSVEHSPNCIIIVVTNPVDAMTYLSLKVSELPRQRVFGLSGALDGARLASFIASELDVPAGDVAPCVIGEHGGSMVVVPRLTMVGGKPLTELLPGDKIKELTERTVNGGAEIVSCLKTGSAFYAPAASAAKMTEAVLNNSKEVINCTAYLDGEYGIEDVTLGVPLRLGENGIEEFIELKLTGEEKDALLSSAGKVKSTIEKLNIA
jgi:malate dehydrogenase